MSLYDQISESTFTAQVIRMAQVFKWRVAHFRPAMTKRGKWLTAVAGDGAGFFDLVLVRPPRVIFAELKSEKGKLSIEQDVWLRQTTNCQGVESYVWRPKNIAEIERILR